MRMAASVLLMAAIVFLINRGNEAALPCQIEQQATPIPPPATATAAPSAIENAPTDSAVQLQPFQTSESWRFGLGVPGGAAQAGWVTRLGAGWWYSWNVRAAEPASGAVKFWQMVRLRRGKLTPALENVLAEAKARPGQVWIIGNEPDVGEQDGLTPACLAYLYHEVYTGLKEADPTARIAPGGITQASPLRLAYLGRVLAEHQARYHAPLPADFWTMHAFILREERGSWGAGIPPGLAEDAGWLRSVEEHDDLGLFRSQVIAFRRWMADRGYRDRPLAITEYGILMPPDYGFGPERVRRFMQASFDFLMTASDPEIGLPTDANRLVQQWAWFSLADPVYPTGNLVAAAQNHLTPLGAAYRDYLLALR